MIISFYYIIDYSTKNFKQNFDKILNRHGPKTLIQFVDFLTINSTEKKQKNLIVQNVIEK
jgi:hypothetical protein